MDDGAMRTRRAISIFAGVGWPSFVLLYAAFSSAGYTLVQSIVIAFVSVLVPGGHHGRDVGLVGHAFRAR